VRSCGVGQIVEVNLRTSTRGLEASIVHLYAMMAPGEILDTDLAAIYGVPTKRLNEQYRRNFDRFPADFAFRLAQGEWAALRSQIATLETGRGGHRKYLPVAFTEHGALMAANILNRPRAVAMSVYVIRKGVSS